MMLYFKLFAKCLLLLNFFVKAKCIEENDTLFVKLDADFNTNVTLPCKKHSQEVNIKWVRTGKKSLHILPNGDLFLANLEKQDSGEYKCMTDCNDLDNDEVLSRIHLNVKTPPAPLENVTVIPWTVLAVLQWSVKDNGGYPINNITVRYKLANEDDEWRVNPHHISSTVTQVEIYKLNPNTTYLFQIWATNKLGPGEPINVTAKTLHDVQEIELARHLLDGAETFDTRAWLAAVAIVMTTLLILTVGTCCVLYRDSHVSSYQNEECDPERIELMPNVITNPGYYEEFPLPQCNTSETPDDEDDFTSYFATRSGARAVRV